MRYYEPALRPYGESAYVSDEKRGGGGNPRRWSKDGIHMDARPKNWLVPVTLAMLSECSSYGYDIMERAVEFGYINYPYFAHHDPFLASVRAEPRFARLMERVKRDWEAFEA